MERLPADTLRAFRLRELLRDDVEICCDNMERSVAFDRVCELSSDHSGGFLRCNEAARSNELFRLIA